MKSSKITVLLAALGLTTMLSGQSIAQETVVVGFDGSFPPFASIGADGELQGFEVELVSGICAAAQLTCDLRNLPWDGIFTALDTGKIDVVAAALNITEERKQKYAMVGPFFKSPDAYMAAASSSLDGTDEGLSGKTIGVVTGGVYENYLNAKGTVTVSPYDSMDAAVLDLGLGRVDAVLGEEAQLRTAYVNTQPDEYKIIGEPFSDPAYSGQGKGMAIRKSDEALISAFEKGLAAVIADGTHAQLTKKWFGTEMPAN